MTLVGWMVLVWLAGSALAWALVAIGGEPKSPEDKEGRA